MTLRCPHPNRRTCLLLIAIAVVCVAVPYATAATLFGLVDTGELYVSVDAGATWSVRSALPVSDAIDIAAAETSNELYMAARSGLLFRSLDAGMNWSGVGAVTAGDVTDMLIRPNGDILLLTATGTLFRSDDDGASLSAIAELTASNCIGLSTDANDYLYVVSQTGEVARSTNDGASWSTVGAVTTSGVVRTLGIGSDLYLLTSTGDLALSDDQGGSWSFIGTTSQVNTRGFTTNGGTLVAATQEGLVATSNDGVTWTFVGSINQVNVVAIGNDTPTATGIGPDRPPVATAHLFAPWPNPAGAGATQVRFRLPAAATVTLELFNARGRRIAERTPQAFDAAGDFTVEWGLDALPSGVYFIRLKTSAGMTAHNRIVVVR